MRQGGLQRNYLKCRLNIGQIFEILWLQMQQVDFLDFRKHFLDYLRESSRKQVGVVKKIYPLSTRYSMIISLTLVNPLSPVEDPTSFLFVQTKNRCFWFLKIILNYASSIQHIWKKLFFSGSQGEHFRWNFVQNWISPLKLYKISPFPLNFR